jgi:hypothetical protein
MKEYNGWLQIQEAKTHNQKKSARGSTKKKQQKE